MQRQDGAGSAGSRSYPTHSPGWDVDSRQLPVQLRAVARRHHILEGGIITPISAKERARTQSKLPRIKPRTLCRELLLSRTRQQHKLLTHIQHPSTRDRLLTPMRCLFPPCEGQGAATRKTAESFSSLAGSTMSVVLSHVGAVTHSYLQASRGVSGTSTIPASVRPRE